MKKRSFASAHTLFLLLAASLAISSCSDQQKDGKERDLVTFPLKGEIERLARDEETKP